MPTDILWHPFQLKVRTSSIRCLYCRWCKYIKWQQIFLERLLRLIETVQTSTEHVNTQKIITVISIGFIRIFFARASTCLGNVAENMTVCRDGWTLSIILITCRGKNYLNKNIVLMNVAILSKKRGSCISGIIHEFWMELVWWNTCTMEETARIS